jgi:hypothetical protein
MHPQAQTFAGPSRARRPLAGPVACGAALAGLAAYVALNDPSAPGTHLPACPMYQLTGLWCPGCGVTRAAHAALRGDLGAAFRFNALFPVFLGAIAVTWLAWLRRALGRAPIVGFRNMPMWAPIAAGVVLVVFGVVRNLPGFDALRP